MFSMELFLLAGSAVFIGVLGAFTALGWGVLQLVKSHTSAGLFASPLDWIALASMVGGASLGTALLAPLISPIVVPIIAPIAMAISAAIIGPTTIAAVIAAIIGSIAIAAIFAFFIGSPTDDGLQQFFLYQEESSVNLILDHEKQMSFYRVVSYGASDETVRLELSTCMAPNPEASEYDFVGCPDGSYYPLALNEDVNDAINNQEASQLKSTAQGADSLLGQLISKVDGQLFGTSTDISDLEDQIASHAAKVNHHHNQVRRHHDNLRHCAWWDAPCRGHNAWLRGQISYHGYWNDHHSSKRGEKAHHLASLEQEQMQLTRDRQQLVETKSELSAKRQQLEVAQQTSSITHHDDGSISMADSDLGIGVHWVQDYTTQITSLSDSDGGYQITVDCPLMQKVCETLQLNHDQYPLLWQQGIAPVRLLSDGITSHYDISSNQWRVTVINNGSTDESSSEHGAHNAFSLALYYDYRSGEASGPGSSSDQSQVIQQGVFDYAKYSGALKGRWHRGDIEQDDREIVRWQRIESLEQGGQSGLVFTENLQLIVPDRYPGISYYTPNRPRRLVELVLMDLNEDGLDDLLSVYSDSSGTTLTYRSPIVVANQSLSDEVVLAYLSAVNIDRVQLIQGTHHVYGKQDGVNYLLLHSKTDSQLYPVALVQPKQTDLTQASIDQLQIASADPVDNALATDAIWLNDPAYGFTAGDQLLLSWVRSGESHGQNKDSLPSVYIDRNQLSVEQRTYALTALEDTNPTDYSFVPASDREGTDATLDMQWNTYGLTRDLPGCELSTTYSYRGHLSLQLINDPQAADNQLGAVVSATNACELVRAMDPYHRGKTDRLLVQNHQQSLNAWSHLDLSHLPQDRFAFYLDYSHGAYQPQGILAQASLEAAAYQYPLSASLQSEYLPIDDVDELAPLIATLNGYCERENADQCLLRWMQQALNTSVAGSLFNACDAYSGLNEEFINCIEGIVRRAMSSLNHNDNFETDTHIFTYKDNQGSAYIERRMLGVAQHQQDPISKIDIDGAFSLMKDLLAIDTDTDADALALSNQKSLLMKSLKAVLDITVPESHAMLPVIVATMAGASEVFATVGLGIASTGIAVGKISQSLASSNDISLQNNAEAGLAMQAAQSIENKHFHFCPNGDSAPVICDQNNPESSKISITQLEDRFSILVVLNDASPRLLEIGTDHPSYHQIRSLYEGGQSQLQALIKNIIDLVQDQKRITFEVDTKQYAINRSNSESSYTVAWLRVSDDGAEEKVPLITIGLDHPLYTQTSALFPDSSAAQQASYVDNLINHIVSVQLTQLPELDEQQTDPLSLQDNQALMNYNWEKQRLDLKFNAHKKHFFFPDSTIGTNVYIHNPRYVDSGYLMEQELTGEQLVLHEYLSQTAKDSGDTPMIVTFGGQGCGGCTVDTTQERDMVFEGAELPSANQPLDPSLEDAEQISEKIKIKKSVFKEYDHIFENICRNKGDLEKMHNEATFLKPYRDSGNIVSCFTIGITGSTPGSYAGRIRQYVFHKWNLGTDTTIQWFIDCDLERNLTTIVPFGRNDSHTCNYNYYSDQMHRKLITVYLISNSQNNREVSFSGAFAEGNQDDLDDFFGLPPYAYIDIDGIGDDDGGSSLRVIDHSNMFHGIRDLDEIQINVENSTNFRGMFEGAEIFGDGNDENIRVWDTSKVTNMSRMFYGAKFFNQPIGEWDTSKVTNMSLMFYGAKYFNQPIGEWDTSNVKDMSSMFEDADAFDKPIVDWDTSKVTNMSGMFKNAKKFNKTLYKWNTGKVTNMSEMFYGAETFNLTLRYWDTKNVTNMSGMFMNAGSFDKPIGDWNTSQVITMQSMFEKAKSFNRDISKWDISNVNNMRWMFIDASAFQRNISNWVVRSDTDIRGFTNQSRDKWRIGDRPRFQ